jgi:hypothetical protein
MKEAISKAPSGRPTRQPVGLRNRLKVHNQDPNYVYRWVVDYDGTGDRIEEFKLAGYEICPKDAHKMDARANSPSAEGSSETLSVGGGQKAVLMRQKRENYDEDQKEKSNRVDESEKALKKPNLDGSYGKVNLS